MLFSTGDRPDPRITMSKPEELLVAVDGASHSDRVVEMARDYAKRLNMKVHVVCVAGYEDISRDLIQYAKVESVDLSEYYHTIAKAATSKYEGVFRVAGVPCSTTVERGDPAVKIVDIAKSRKASLIFLGIKELRGAGKVMALGSVARRVIEASPCPVMVIP